MHKLHRLTLLMPIVLGLSITALNAATECDKPGWDTQGWGAPTHYFAVGAVKAPGKYIWGAYPNEIEMAAVFGYYEYPPFACGLTAEATGQVYVIRNGRVYAGVLEKEKHFDVKFPKSPDQRIQFDDHGGGLSEQDVVYFPAKTPSDPSAVGQKFTIVGAVHKPGEYAFKQPLRLADAIQLAQGVTRESAQQGFRLRGDEIRALQSGDFVGGSAGTEIAAGDIVVIAECRTREPYGPLDARPLCK